MSKLERARDKLTALRDASTKGTWIVVADKEDSNVCPAGEGVVLWGSYPDSRDTNLVVALHATIDAQLDILNRSIDQRAKYRKIGADYKQLAKKIGGAPATPRPAWKTLAKNRDAYVLATAILGESA